MSSTVAFSGKFLILSVKSYILPNSTISSIASTSGIGVMMAACFWTIMVDFTSSIDPSEYFTIIVTSIVPAVFVSGFSLNSKVVFAGKFCRLSISFSASIVSPSKILISFPAGLFANACVFVAFATISTEFSIASPGLIVQLIGSL